MLLAIFVGLLLILFLIGVAVPYALGITAVVGMLYSGSFGVTEMGTVAMRMATGVNSFTLLAIPFFLLAGKLMNVGSITQRIFNFCNALVGWIPGGLGQVNILASVVFAGMSGSAVADAAGLGTIEIKAMEDEGFDTEFSAGITAASSTIGPIIPPSIPLIMFGCAGSGLDFKSADRRNCPRCDLRNLPGDYGSCYVHPPEISSQRISDRKGTVRTV